MKNQSGQGLLKSSITQKEKNTNLIGDALHCKKVFKIKKLKAVKDYNKKLINLFSIT